MTNSARGNDMDQFDLDALKALLRDRGHSFDIFWQRVKDLVYTVKSGFVKDFSETSNAIGSISPSKNLSKLMIPKIYGYDILVDKNIIPWLVEINRFPGLEPRNEQDRQVKQLVVEASWELASRKAGLPAEAVLGVSFSSACYSTLEKVSKLNMKNC